MNPADRLTLVITAFNEQDALPLLHPRLCAQLDAMADVDGRILYVDDGSSDATWAVIEQLAQDDRRVAALRLSRNFGKEIALTAGLDAVEEGAAIMLDADGQDPPELIPEFVALWRQGYDDVHGTRWARDGDGWMKRATAAVFYRLIGRLSKTPIPADTGDFRLLSPRRYGKASASPGAASSVSGNCGISRWKASPAFPPRRCARRPTWACSPRPVHSCSVPGWWARPRCTATGSPVGRR